MKDLQESLGDVQVLPPSSGRSVGAVSKQSADGRVPVLMRPVYDSRPPGVLDFVVDNVLLGGGLPYFNIESDLLEYTAPDGYIAVVNEINWYITPQNNAIDAAQLSMRLFVDDAVVQGTDTMGIGQSGTLDNLYIPVKAGANLKIRLGRGPGVVRYSSESARTLRVNGDPNGFSVSGSTFTGVNKIPVLASINGVLYYLDKGGPRMWRSYNGSAFTNIGNTPSFASTIKLGSFKNYLYLTDGTTFYYSLNGVDWVLSNPDMSVSTGGFLVNIDNYVEFGGFIYAWATGNTTMYRTDDLGATWTGFQTVGLDTTLQYNMTAFNNKLYAVAVSNVNMLVYESIDGINFTEIKNSATIDGVESWATRTFFILAAFNGYLWCGFGDTSGLDSDKLFRSVDGRTWTEISAAFNGYVPLGRASVTVSPFAGLVIYAENDTASGFLNDTLFGRAQFPAIYDPQLRCYAQIRGQLIKAKGSVESTLVNPL